MNGKQPVGVEGAHKHQRPWVIVCAFVVGGATMAVGVLPALENPADAHPLALAVHLVGFDLVHDLVFAPLVLAAGLALRRFVPARVRVPVSLAAASTLLVGVFSYPLLRRWGQRPLNSSTLPLPYGRNISIVIAVIWLVAAAAIIRRLRATDTK
jgi:hypothetical protein